MTAIPSLAEVVATHRWHRTLADPRRVRCTAPDCGWSADLTGGVPSTVLVGEHVEQVWADVRTIRTVAELDELPTNSAIRKADGEVLGRAAGGWTACDYVVWPEASWLPALLIDHPDWSMS